MIMATHTSAEIRRLAFEVTTDVPLPIGEQVFVTGNQPALGNWNPAALPLTRMDDRVWTAHAIVPTNERIEIKVTRGAWDTEAVNEDDTTPGNLVLEPGGGDQPVKIRVAKWKDASPRPEPQIIGDYQVHEGFHSRYLRFDRKIIVWLPPSYNKDIERRYPVLYMQDGQQVFDPQTSTWKHDWQIDEWCTQLIGEYRLDEIIVVAVYCTEDRYLEYNPSMAGREYARFIFEELKPFIDSTYRTKPGRETTAVAGASMGATISFFLAWTRPDIFSSAACLSPAFKFRDDRSCLDIVAGSTQPPDLKLYLYCGEGDKLERELMSGMREMESLLKARGFAEGKNLLVATDPEAEHNEAAWAKHSDQWLLFLFGR